MPVLKKCFICDSSVSVTPSRSASNKTGKFYCSKECRDKGRVGSNNSNYKTGLANVNCKKCNKELFIKRKDVLKNGNFCSTSCSTKFYAEQRKYKFKNLRVKKTCKTCGVDIYIKKSHASKCGTYCSTKCMAEGYKKSLTGNNNPNYRHGQSGIGLYRKNAVGSFSKKDIDRLMQRQQGYCALCKDGLFEVDYHIDHIIPLAKGGSNFIGNIQILCSQCNQRKSAMLPIEYKKNVLKGLTEDKLQELVFIWMRKQKNVDAFKTTFHTPNGGYRNKATAARLKRMGVMAGVPDIFMATPSSGYFGLYIELKVGKNKLTDSQKFFMSKVSENGYATAVCYNMHEVKKTIEDYLKIELEPVDDYFRLA